MERNSKKGMFTPKLWVKIVGDILLAGIILLVFAFFDHVMPRSEGPAVNDPGKVATDVSYSYAAHAFDDSSRLGLYVSAVSSKNITSAILSVSYDAAQVKYLSTEISDGLFTKEMSETAADGKLTYIIGADGSSESVFGKESAEAFIIWFEKTEELDTDLYTFKMSSDALTAADGSEVTVEVKNGDVVVSSSGDFRDKFPDKFTDGEIVETENSYKSSNVNVSYIRHEEELSGKKVVWYEVDIYVRSYEYFRAAFAENTYGSGIRDSIPDMAVANNALVAVNGDYYGARGRGIVVRNGVRYGKNRDDFRDILVMYKDGSMKTFEEGEYGNMDFSDENIWQVWSFGPEILGDNGAVKTKFNTDVKTYNPRTAVGYYEPGHYCFLLINGRGSEDSAGMTCSQMSELFNKMGCVAAYNLDGGQTSVGTWNGEFLNTPYKGGRSCSDIVYIPKG